MPRRKWPRRYRQTNCGSLGPEPSTEEVARSQRPGSYRSARICLLQLEFGATGFWCTSECRRTTVLTCCDGAQRNRARVECLVGDSLLRRCSHPGWANPLASDAWHQPNFSYSVLHHRDPPRPALVSRSEPSSRRSSRCQVPAALPSCGSNVYRTLDHRCLVLASRR